TAVMMRNVSAIVGGFEGHIPAGRTIEERLTRFGTILLDWALTGDTVDLMRVGISEARRFPDLASGVQGMARQCGEGAVGQLLNDMAQSDGLGALPAFAPERLATTAQFFMDLVFKPMILRALFGEKLETLRTQIAAHVASRVAFFLAACRDDGITWDLRGGSQSRSPSLIEIAARGLAPTLTDLAALHCCTSRLLCRAGFRIDSHNSLRLSGARNLAAKLIGNCHDLTHCLRGSLNFLLPVGI